MRHGETEAQEMMTFTPIAIWLLSTCFKLMLWPTYRSTDFAVHAHWLALTRSQPPANWYFDVSSRWTLDYPPLFAWFEYVLGMFFPPAEMLQKQGFDEEHSNCWRNATESPTCFSPKAVLWHRASVAISELLVLFVAVKLFTKTWPETTTSESARSKEKVLFTLLLIAFDPNLIVLDHVHFQYNGYLLGILIFSLASLRGNRPILGAFSFAILLGSKHIFLYAAPLYFVYLLASYCLSYKLGTFVIKVATLGVVVGTVFFSSIFSVCSPPTNLEELGNFLGCVKQVGGRLFPVQERGLVHAYWAPNFWALYAGTDRILKVLLAKTWGLTFDSGQHGVSSTQGLVQGEIRFDVLPQVPTFVTAILSLAGMIPALRRVWKCRQPQILLHAYACCVMSCIFFGYHVHEKALLMVSLPLALCALDSSYDARCYLTLTWITQVALAPLLFPQELTSFKTLLLITHVIWSFFVLDMFHSRRKREGRMKNSGLLSLCTRFFIDGFYLAGLIIVFCVYEYGPFLESQFLQPSKQLLSRFPFLSLLLVSTYCAVGVAKCWIDLYVLLARKQKAIESYGNSPHIRPSRAPKVS